jgi:hypothetical protein
MEDSYNTAAKFHADMASRKLQLPSIAKSGDIVVFSATKDWKSDLKKIESGSVQANVIIVGKNDNLYDAAHGRIYSANEVELKMWDYGFVVDLEDFKGISTKVDKIVQNTVEAIDKLKENGKV